jgi:hypothetical protein
MDRDCPLEGRIRGAGVHHVEDAVDRLVAASAQDGCAEDFRRLRVHHHLHESLRLILLDSAPHTGHWPMSDEQGSAARARLGFGDADAAERRVDIESIGRNPLAHAARLATQEVGRNDLEVVVGRVCEGAAAIAVAERPDARHVGRELIVDADVAARVGRDTGLVEPEVVRVGSTPNGQKDVAAGDLGFA